jgi:hypothetical protein
LHFNLVLLPLLPPANCSTHLQATSTAGQRSTVPQLPVELLSQVLRHVDLQQRLGSCSLVCKAWRAAAAAATSKVSLKLNTFEQPKAILARSLGQWLGVHGAAVTHLSVTDAHPHPFAPFQLPCTVLTQLQELKIHSCQLQEPGSSSVSVNAAHGQQQHLTAHQSPSFLSSSSSSTSGQHSLACMTNLTALLLDNVKYGLSDAVSGLSELTGLQQLVLGALLAAPLQTLQDHEDDSYLKQELRRQQLGENAVTSLYQLSQLTQLELHNQPVPLYAPRLFAHMQQLQELILLGVRVMSADVLQDLPASVTKLELGWRGSLLSSSTAPAVARLRSLQHLVLDADGSEGFDPSLISSMQQLRVLSLKGDMISDTEQHDEQAAATGAPLCQLLDALSQLSQLETLAIISTSYEDMQPLSAHDTAKYSALLSASPHLTQLQLCWEGEAGLLPEDCWQHVFAAGVQRPQLKELWVGLPRSVLDDPDTEEVAAMIAATPSCFGLVDVDRLVQCCPALEYLSIPGMVEEGMDLSPLTALTALTGLIVGGDAVGDGAIIGAVVPLTRLRGLQIYHAPFMTDQGLLALSALRRLKELGAWDCGISEAVWLVERSVDFATLVRFRNALLSTSGQGCSLGACTEPHGHHSTFEDRIKCLGAHCCSSA